MVTHPAAGTSGNRTAATASRVPQRHAGITSDHRAHAKMRDHRNKPRASRRSGIYRTMLFQPLVPAYTDAGATMIMKHLLTCTQGLVVVFALGCPLALAQEPSIASTVEPEKRLEQLNIKLPAVSAPVGIYRRAVVVDNMIYLAGHIPIDAQGQAVTGKVGRDADLDSARAAARQCGLAMLATLRAELGSLNRVRRLVKTTGMVNCTTDFIDQPAVINGCSQLFVDVFGKDRGVGARSAVGMSALPKGAMVEIEAIFEIEN